MRSICLQECLTPQYLLSLNICGGRGFPVAGLASSGTFSLIHFLLASFAAMSHSSNSILLAARKPITSCCCFLICVWGRAERMTEGKLSVKTCVNFSLMRKQKGPRLTILSSVCCKKKTLFFFSLLWEITPGGSLAALLLSYHSFVDKWMNWWARPNREDGFICRKNVRQWREKAIASHSYILTLTLFNTGLFNTFNYTFN